MIDDIKRVAAVLKGAQNIAVLTGAGVSAESGVPTFRGADGLWKNFRAEELATPEAFDRDPRLVWEWYDWRRQKIAACAPNPGHAVLASWEGRLADFTLVTQNVDGLHRRAGNRNVLYLHGDIWTIRCTRCGAATVDETVPLPAIPPHCACGGLQRPGVVWFGEALPEAALTEAIAAMYAAELVFVVGTSALVYPAAGLPAAAKSAGACVVEVNLDPTPLTPLADYFLAGPSGQVLPQLDQEAFGR